MKVTADIVRCEFIGTEVKVTKSTHEGYVGISGKVLDETRNTFLILEKGKKKRIVKNSSYFHFNFPDGTIIEINGRTLIGQPHDRIKKRIRRMW